MVPARMTGRISFSNPSVIEILIFSGELYGFKVWRNSDQRNVRKDRAIGTLKK